MSDQIPHVPVLAAETGVQPPIQEQGAPPSPSLVEAHVLKALAHIAAATALESVEGGPDPRLDGVRRRIGVLASEITALLSGGETQVLDIYPEPVTELFSMVDSADVTVEQDLVPILGGITSEESDGDELLNESSKVADAVVIEISDAQNNEEVVASTAPGSDSIVDELGIEAGATEITIPHDSETETGTINREIYVQELGKLFGMDVSDLTDEQLGVLYAEFKALYTGLSIRRLSAEAKQDRVDQVLMRLQGASNKEIGEKYGLTHTAIWGGLNKVVDSFQKRLALEERKAAVNRARMWQQLGSTAISSETDPTLLDDTAQHVDYSATPKLTQDQELATEKSQREEVVVIKPRELRVDGVVYEITPEESKILRLVRNQTQAGQNVTTASAVKRLFPEIAGQRGTREAVEEALFELVQKGFLTEVAPAITRQIGKTEGEDQITLEFRFNPNINQTRESIHTLYVGQKKLYVQDDDVKLLEKLLESGRTYEPTELSNAVHGGFVEPKVHYALVRRLKKYFVAQGVAYRQRPRFVNEPARFGIKDEVRHHLERAIDEHHAAQVRQQRGA